MVSSRGCSGLGVGILAGEFSAAATAACLALPFSSDTGFSVV